MTAAYTPIPLIVPKAPILPITATSLDYVETASGGPVAGDQLGDAIPLNGPELVLFHSTDAGAQTATVLSVPDSFNRKGDITAYGVGAGLRSALFMRPEGFRQADGSLYVDASATTIGYSVFKLPAGGKLWSATSVAAATRVPISPITAKGPYLASVTPLALDFTFTAMSATVGNNIKMNGPLLLLFTSSGSHTFTLTSVADAAGRTGDVTYTVGSGLYSAVYLRPDGFRQTDGNLYLIANSTSVSVAAFACPA
jgi:hypothetical protein